MLSPALNLFCMCTCHCASWQDATSPIRFPGLGRGSPKIWGLWSPAPLDGVWLPPRNTPVYHSVTFGHYRSNHTSVIIGHSLEKFHPSRPAFQSYSRYIGTNRDRSATYDFRLVFHSNHGPISYCFWDKRRFRSKIGILSHPLYFAPPLRIL